MKITFMIMAIVMTTGCKSNQSGMTNDPAALNDIWALEEINGVVVSSADFGHEIPVLEFHQADGKIIGNSGCNRLSGTYKIDGAKISFGPLISTKMACTGNGEPRFLAALNSVSKFKIEGLKLYLFNNDVESLQFRKVD